MINNKFDKIRILWIDDRENAEGYPQKMLPVTDRYNDFFHIAHPSTTEEDAYSYRSTEDFMDGFNRHWYQQEDHPCDYFPVEIIATDYNLNKSPRGLEGSRNDSCVEEIWHTSDSNDAHSSSLSSINFDGLQIAVFYATMTEMHPAALVSMTHYMSKMPSGVSTLHKLAAPFLGSNFEKNLGGAQRSWENIIHTALPPLRERIEHLFVDRGDIEINTGDLLRATLGEGETLTITSPHGKRCLPLQGLFFDFPEEKRGAEIQAWTDELYNLRVKDDFIQDAQQLAEKIWEAGKNEKLIEQRERISYIFYCLEQKETLDSAILQEFDPSEKDTLVEFFGYKKGRGGRRGTCNKNCYGVNMITREQTDSVIRWACVILLYKYCKEYLQGMKKHQDLGVPTPIDVQTIFSLFFPVPDGTVVLAPHHGKDTALGKKLDRLTDANGRSIKLHIKDVLNGEDWRRGGPFGLTHQERHFIQKMIKDEEHADSACNADGPCIHEDDWKRCPPTRLIAWGKNKES